MTGASDKSDRAVVNGAASVSAVPASVPSADEPRQLAEALARYLDPDAFNGRRRSKRNSDAAYRARKHAMKQAKAAIRFMIKPGNIDRLLVTQAAKISNRPAFISAVEAKRAAQAMSAGTAKTEGLGGDSPASAVRQDAPETPLSPPLPSGSIER